MAERMWIQAQSQGWWMGLSAGDLRRAQQLGPWKPNGQRLGGGMSGPHAHDSLFFNQYPLHPTPNSMYALKGSLCPISPW